VGPRYLAASLGGQLAGRLVGHVITLADGDLTGHGVLDGALKANELPGVGPVQPSLSLEVVLPEVGGDDLAVLHVDVAPISLVFDHRPQSGHGLFIQRAMLRFDLEEIVPEVGDDQSRHLQ
jgi:hypothetical protein